MPPGHELRPGSRRSASPAGLDTPETSIVLGDSPSVPFISAAPSLTAMAASSNAQASSSAVPKGGKRLRSPTPVTEGQTDRGEGGSSSKARKHKDKQTAPSVDLSRRSRNRDGQSSQQVRFYSVTRFR